MATRLEAEEEAISHPWDAMKEQVDEGGLFPRLPLVPGVSRVRRPQEDPPQGSVGLPRQSRRAKMTVSGTYKMVKAAVKDPRRPGSRSSGSSGCSTRGWSTGTRPLGGEEESHPDQAGPRPGRSPTELQEDHEAAAQEETEQGQGVPPRRDSEAVRGRVLRGIRTWHRNACGL